MLIGKALLLKGLGGLAAIGGAIGGGYSLYDYYSNQETKFDRGLIEFLNEGGNIQFSVKKVDGSNSESDISNDFPSFTDNTGSQTKTATVTIKVSVNTAATGNDGGTLTEKNDAAEGSKAKKSYLQKLNGNGTDAGTAWTWECKIVFEKPTTITGTELKDKEKLVKDSEEKGFFNKLKDTDTENKHKELKIKFIKDCAAARGKAENRKINKLGNLTSTTPTNNKIESTKTFELRNGVNTSGEEEGKLYPVDQSDFNSWFKNEGN